MKTAVVILNWNGAQMLSRFLPSVLEHSKGAEVIVADNASTDSSLQLLREQFPEVRTIVLERNYGFAEGYNRALQQVEAEYYVLLNSDVEVTPHWLTTLENYMEAHPDCAAAQPKLLAEWRRTHFEYAGAAGGYIDALGYPYCRGRLIGTVEEDSGQYDGVADIAWATGAALMIRSQDWRAVGGLDGSFFAHQEEIDLCWRLRARGRRIVCCPESVVYHVGGGTLPQGSPRKTYLNFRNNLLLLYKNLPSEDLHRVMCLRRWLDAVAALKELLALNLDNYRAIRRARRDFSRIRHDYDAVREENLRLTTHYNIRTRVCLLWQYYLRRRTTYSQLPQS
ncbi:MAG: glycosyltransferase family 2 protein [Bacteroidaceae bacterium]|nr:glycosyltransferase family 2 protein [Bacteroidaceae bacterium]